MASIKDFSLDIVVAGKALPKFEHQGKVYFPAELGKEFAVRLSVPYSGRYEGVISVDGLDVLTGKSASALARGYVFDWATRPDANDITGFRLNDQQVAKFHFIGRDESYAGLTERPANVGVIAVIIYAEYQRRPVYRGSDMLGGTRGGTRGGASFGATSKGGGGLEHSVGAGFGDVADSRVDRVHFQRGEEIGRIVLEYDTREKLISAGIIKDGPFQEVNPFPADANPPITGCQPPAGWKRRGA